MPGDNHHGFSRRRSQAAAAYARESTGELTRKLEAALRRRALLLAQPDTDVCRLCNGAGDGISGLVIEKFGDVLVAQLYEGRLAMSEDRARALCEYAAAQTHSRAVYKKLFVRDRSQALAATMSDHQNRVPWIGDAVPEELPVRESGVRFLVRPYDGY
ncbi:MAG: hypothetical protein JXO22_07195, partial [Phycisphaerae bacterium]|nr:hypothetical protein [Phycisphaerae bacterium]